MYPQGVSAYYTTHKPSKHDKDWCVCVHTSGLRLHEWKKNRALDTFKVPPMIAKKDTFPINILLGNSEFKEIKITIMEEIVPQPCHWNFSMSLCLQKQD